MQINFSALSATTNVESTVIVIGAGLAGLAAAHRLRQAGVNVIVLEKNTFVGGRACTAKVEGFNIDPAAGFFASFYKNTLSLMRELRLEQEIMPIHGKGAIVRNGHPQSLRANLRLKDTPLLSLRSKLLFCKAFYPVFRHWHRLNFHAFHLAYPQDTHSVTQFALHSLNQELLDYVIEPLLSSIFYWAPEQTSQAMLFILLKAGLGGLQRFTLRRGVGQLAEAIAHELPIFQQAEVRTVTPLEEGGYLVNVNVGGEEGRLRAKGILCAATANTVALLFPDLTAKQRNFFSAITYSQTALATIAFDHHPFPGLRNIMVPRQEKVPYLAALSSLAAKNSAQLPPGAEMLKLYASGEAAPGLLAQDDLAIRHALVSDLPAIGLAHHSVKAELFHRVYRWQYALPMFDVGHFARLHSFAAGEIESGRVVFAGDYIGGPFIEGAITSGIDAANRLLTLLH